ncbi:MAG: hypothetical protein IKE22_04935 [Atopobiaceae bacterium]|nr:hypothetical protein [Atopobiaceae bacterium]
MLHRDYLLEIIGEFVNTVIESLGLAYRRHNPSDTQTIEEAVAGLLDLDADLTFRLEPDSLVTMMILSGIGDSLADYVTYSLTRLGEVYEQMGDEETAALRRSQAEAVAESFGCDPDVVPPEFQEFEQERVAELSD